MEPLLLFPDPAPPALAQTLDLCSYPWKAVSSPEAAERIEPEDGWSGAIVCADLDPDGAFALCRSDPQARPPPRSPAADRVWPPRSGELELREDLFDDFCVLPWQGQELEARLAHLFWRTGRGTRPELVEYGPRCSTWRPTRPRSPGGRST